MEGRYFFAKSCFQFPRNLSANIFPHKDNPINELNSNIITAKDISKGPASADKQENRPGNQTGALNQTPIT